VNITARFLPSLKSTSMCACVHSVSYIIYYHAGPLRARQSKCSTFGCQINISYILIQGIVNPACPPASTRPREPGVTLNVLRSSGRVEACMSAGVPTQSWG
jgi:hypothetical protein